MKKTDCILYFAMTISCLAKTAEEEQAVNYGTDTKVVFKVLDDRGLTVSNAYVKAGFYLNGKKGNAVHDYTGTSGLLVAERKSVGEINYWIRKEAHYETSGRFNFVHTGVKDGRWQPYGLTNTVVLKRKVNPVAMKVASYLQGHHSIPVVGVPLGFDVEANDWAVPHGKGKAVDFTVTYLWDGSMYSQYTGADLIVSFTNQYAGVYKKPCDSFSAFKSPYRADTNAVFKSEIKFSIRRKGGNIDSQLQEDECLILRVRPRLDKDGNLAGAHYAKIYGPWRFGFGDTTPGSMSMSCYFNPNENDPNLEADTTKNLLNPGDLGFAP